MEVEWIRPERNNEFYENPFRNRSKEFIIGREILSPELVVKVLI